MLYLEHGEFVWPVTLFPREGFYHSPRDALVMAASLALSGLSIDSSSHAKELPPSKGAISSTILRLERQSASLGEIARWPGMTVERASLFGRRK